MEQQRLIDGKCYQLDDTYSSQAVYSPCPEPPPTAAVVSSITGLAVVVGALAVLLPEIGRRRGLYQTVILNAKRSL
jgi:hypothetical protein